MEITPEEVIKTTDNPIQLFYESLKTPATKKAYINRLKKVLCEFLKPILMGDPALVENFKPLPQKNTGGLKRQFCDVDFEARANEFVRKAKHDHEWAENILITLIKKLSERTRLEKTDPDYIKAYTIKDYIKPVRKLLSKNKVALSWEAIYDYLPSEDSVDDTFGYEISHIQKILKHCKPIERVIVLLWASSGIRAGGFPLQWKYLHPIYEFDGKYLWQDDEVTEIVVEKGKIIAGMMRIYAETRDEYIAFITPECWEAIQLYKEKWIQEVGREPQPNDPFLKKAGFIPRQLNKSGIYVKVDRILRSAGFRKPLPRGVRRHKIPIFNGFRRFFNKANKKSFSKNSVLASLILKENMMGHEGLIQLDKNYFKEHISELIEEYLTSVPNLTILDEERQKIIIEQKTKKITEYEKNQAYAESLEKKLEQTRTEFTKQIEDLKAGIEANKRAVEQDK